MSKIKGFYRHAVENIRKTRQNNIKTLDLKHLNLSSLPPSTFSVSDLEGLQLFRNRLSELPPEIGQLKKLIDLEAEFNQIDKLPRELGDLIELRYLYLKGNKISRLPNEIGKLGKLERLFLNDNEITSLPAEMTNLSNLQVLDLRNNYLNIPPEILENRTNPNSIISYYFNTASIPNDEKTPLRAAKLLLVGQGSVGKTSVVNRLVKNIFNPDENKTDGINITRWKTLDSKYDLNVWDFGGQEIMHATHQFFLTRRAIYLLVIDVRLDEVGNRLDYWLKTIESFGGESPIIIVGNKYDQQPLDLNETGIRAKHPTVTAIIETSCLSGEGIDNLIQEITKTVERLPHVNDTVPKSWSTVKQTLESITKNYMDYDRYLELCENTKIVDKISQETLIDFLNDLGVVLKFTDKRYAELSRAYILNPEWVTQGVYKILNNRDLIQAGGIIDWDRLDNILQPPEYANDKHRRFIIEMMEKFELCYSFGDNGATKILVPDLLRKDEPYTGEWENPLEFEYKYDILPASLLSRFIVRNYNLIHKNVYWRNGVLLNRGNCTAVVIADREENVIRIAVKGDEDYRRSFLTIIREQLEVIHESYNKLNAKEVIYIPDQPGASVNFITLKNNEYLGISTVLPDNSTTTINVKSTLDQFETPAEREYKRRIQESDIPEKLFFHSGDLIYISCHPDDLNKVNPIYDLLQLSGYYPWMPHRDLLIGQNTKTLSQMAIDRSSLFVACISNKSRNSRGDTQIELRDALDKFRGMLPDDIYIIPVRLEEADIIEQLSSLKPLDYF